MSSLRAAFQITWSTLQRRRGSLLTFVGVAALFQFITAVALPLVGGLAGVQSTLESYSPGLRQLLKISPALAEYSLQDHLAFTWLHPFFIGLCAMFVVGRSAEALAGEVESGSVYLVLSRPVPRWTVVLGRVGEIGVGLACILSMSLVGSSVGVALADLDALPLARYVVLVAAAWCLFMALSAVTLVVSSAVSRVGVAVAIGTIWALATYVLDVFPAAATSPLAWLNPWHHYFPPAIIAAGSVAWSSLMVLLGWTVAGTLAAMALFGRRDLV